MSKPKDPCAVCPFIRSCIAEGEDRHWCLVWILTMEAWDRVSQRRKQELDEATRELIRKNAGWTET